MVSSIKSLVSNEESGHIGWKICAGVFNEVAAAGPSFMVIARLRSRLDPFELRMFANSELRLAADTQFARSGWYWFC